MLTTTEAPPTPSDVIWGAAAIGDAIGLSERQAFHALESGHLPGRKVGRKWVSSRAALQEALAIPSQRKVA